ncbi:MAG: N-6 DNA methylase [Anaerolineaceae bacterium]
MLDTETKRRIDTARDILVGKVPDPKSQVEQITIALIYKFMDDMDAEAEELGGQRTFFSGEFARFGWAQLMDVSLGGNETLMRYSEALEKMKENPNIPDLFRNIFRNVFLPYRDPETLKSFLKVINDFIYDHSERLGDAFEYLLSIMGSQGDAGQFRTPRHIIDFMVQLIDPQKNDRVLDPACGTAGFLISAYKHILKTAREADQTLTPDEKTRLMQNFTGYDISPDMVRLSRVNLYLHGFQTPNIHEYDTLTSLERWNESADVILANPPFMSPSGGGIRPHKRFSVESNRSEVLFVDYIMEHLTVAGRAAVIVPEGIIFQSGKAYKALRKMLVENDYLVGVISLPAGVFNPYSGVKTSILWLDRSLAKKTDSIIFAKIESDGFDLGAQRRENNKNDLPICLSTFNVYKSMNWTINQLESENKNVKIVGKSKICDDGDFSLNVEKYKILSNANSKFPMQQISEIAEIISGQSPEGVFYNESGIGLPFYQGKTDFGKIFLEKPRVWTKKVTREAIKNDILMSVRAPVGPVNISTEKICIGRGLCAIRPKENIDYKFIFYCLKHIEKEISGGGGSIFDSISKDQIGAILLPIPPIDIQLQLVAEIESYQKIIDGARMIVENYRPRIEIDPSWPNTKLGDVCVFKRGPFGGSLKKEIFTKEGYAVYEQKHAIYNNFSNIRYFISEEKFSEMSGFELLPGDLIMSCSGTMGKVAIAPEGITKGIINQALLKLTPSTRILKEYLKLCMESDIFQIGLNQLTYGAAIKNVASVQILKNIQIPLPNLEIQKVIVTRIQKEQNLISSSIELIKLFEQKIRDRVSKIWGE